MKERFFFDRVDAKTRGTAIGGEVHVISLTHSHKTGSALSLVESAIARAKVALYPTIVEPMPVSG